MRIAIFTETYMPYVSGVVTHIETLKEGLEKLGHQVMVVTIDPAAEKSMLEDDVLHCPGHPVKKIYGGGITTPVSFQRLRSVEEFQPDVIHIHTEFTMGMFGLWAARRLKKPVVYTLHTMYEDYTGYIFPNRLSGLGKFAVHHWLHFFASRADEIIGPSPKAGDLLERCRIKQKIHIIPNVVYTESADPESRSRIIRELQLEDSDAVLCFAGRLGKEKNVDVLLFCFHEALKLYPSLKLIIIGDGPEKDALARQVADLGMDHAVIFTGMVPHERVLSFLDACDVYVTASTSEMYSVSMLEALSGGLPVLQKLDDINRYQISDGENGWIYQDAGEFCAVISSYLSKTPEEKTALRESVKRDACRFGTEKYFSEMQQIYASAIRHNSRM